MKFTYVIQPKSLWSFNSEESLTFRPHVIDPIYPLGGSKNWILEQECRLSLPFVITMQEEGGGNCSPHRLTFTELLEDTPNNNCINCNQPRSPKQSLYYCRKCLQIVMMNERAIHNKSHSVHAVTADVSYLLDLV